jgi:hypothetical protein
MPHFRRSPSHRRQPSPTAKWLVLGMTEARLVVHGQRTTHLTPVKPSHHRKRYLPAQRLAVKSYVGGVTECHVVVSDAGRIQLGQVDYGLVRELGYIRVDAFQEAWVAEHEPDFDGEPLERFQRRHAHREMWVIRFALDRTQAPRLLAARSDELYVENAAMALAHEFPALTPDEHEFHIARPARDREARRQQMLVADRAALDTGQRASYARHAASTKGLDMRSEFRLYDRLVRLERAVEALRQLELIESRVFPQRRAA